MARYLAIEYTATITFAGNDGGSDLVSPGNGLTALRSFPLQHCMTSANITIANVAVSSTPRDTIQELVEALDESAREGIASVCPSVGDINGDYSQNINTGVAGNPLAGFAAGEEFRNRGGFFDIVESGVTNTAATWTVHVIEPMIAVPPFLPPRQALRSKGFVRMTTNMQLEFNLDGDCQRMISHDNVNGNTVTSITVSFNPATVFYRSFFYSTPAEQRLPEKDLYYAYNTIAIRKTAVSANVLANGSLTMNMNNISLHAIPELMILSIRQPDSALDAFDADSWGSITSIVVQFGNSTGLLSTAREDDLYAISFANGCNMPFPRWQRVGSPLFLRMSDLGVSPLDASGVQSNSNLSFQVTFTNRSASTKTYELRLLPLMSNIMVVEPATRGTGHYTINQGYITPQDVAMAVSAELYVAPSEQIEGAGLFGSLGRAFGNIGKSFLQPIVGLGKSFGRELQRLPGQFGQGFADAAALAAMGGNYRRRGGSVKRRRLIGLAEPGGQPLNIGTAQLHAGGAVNKRSLQDNFDSYMNDA